jgi:hypothetical protein
MSLQSLAKKTCKINKQLWVCFLLAKYCMEEIESMNTRTVTIRMPTDLFKWVEKLATLEHRSFTQQIVKIVEDAKKKEESVGKPK